MRMKLGLTALCVMLASHLVYGADISGCTGCHGQQFEKAALGKSKIVKDMSKDEIIAALKGYKDGSYGRTMKGMMTGQVASLNDKAIEEIATTIKSANTSSVAPTKPTKMKVVDINKKATDPKRIKAEDLSKKRRMKAEEIGLRKTDLFSESKKTVATKTDYARPAPGSSTRFERAYTNAPPMIPHDIEGFLPITKENNQCVGCHMPEVAVAMGATPIPPTHFTNYRPKVELKDGEVLHEGKAINKDISDTGAIKTVAHKTDGLYQGRFNCSQCHAPQSKNDVLVGNTFKPDFKESEDKTASNLLDTINEGVE